MQTVVSGLIGSGQWTTSGSNIYNANSGNVGIGTAGPAWKLHIFDAVAPVIQIAEGDTGGNTFLGQDGNNFFIRRGTIGTTDAMTISSSGDVGISTYTPSQKLDVTGNIRSSGELIGTMTTTGFGQVRMISGGYGAFWRNDGVDTYLLFTAINDQYGSWNTLRPVYFNNATAVATFGANVYAPAFLYSSDRRLKEKIQPLDKGLLDLMKFRPVSFTWKSGVQKGQDDIGFIAQEVETVIPGLVHTDDKGMKSIDYIKIVPVLVKAMQEQQAKIDSLEKRLDALEK